MDRNVRKRTLCGRQETYLIWTATSENVHFMTSTSENILNMDRNVRKRTLCGPQR